ncbi:kunitz-type protease inhibitor 1-like [Daphnia pulex]|uniref:kunitz-type protease inhibitor 1-like n=1 Tax=Daphnia pulex TaxID=6669 RepID=UPI001EE04E18|nr:kunitz-type protease inhibitor 1-like [Daphnia pulex]
MSATFVVMLCLVAFSSAAPQLAVPVPVFAQRPLDPVCLLPPLNPKVRCNQFSIKWYYDSATRDCEKIFYTGCGGSENLFASEDLCELRCDQDNFDSYESVEDFQQYPSLQKFRYFVLGK